MAIGYITVGVVAMVVALASLVRGWISGDAPDQNSPDQDAQSSVEKSSTDEPYGSHPPSW
ncbi:MAG: hypothetical protein ACTH1D_03180 [Mycobacteriaceae bacterium]|uniref:hypothetical protein n=1 Tax=Corynebacterium sp. TaxID=1720 RepID=UPI003F9CA0A5